MTLLLLMNVSPKAESNKSYPVPSVLSFLGRIKAVQLEYSEAHKNLVQAIRKAPQHSAVGFKQTVSKSPGNVSGIRRIVPKIIGLSGPRSLVQGFKSTYSRSFQCINIFSDVNYLH